MAVNLPGAQRVHDERRRVQPQANVVQRGAGHPNQEQWVVAKRLQGAQHEISLMGAAVSTLGLGHGTND